MLISRYYFIPDQKLFLCKVDNIEPIESIELDKTNINILDIDNNIICSLESRINIEDNVDKIIFIENELGGYIKEFEVERS